MASKKAPAQQSSVNMSYVGAKEITLIFLAMIVLAGAAAAFALLG
ncbi:hypothetical protein [Catenulispora pinisilvae]|nr:hypothetical protein [Catenulispora pinisilvae]